MFTRRLASFVLAMLTGLASGFAPSAYADDTDIYLSGSGGGRNIVRPNVLFVLDTSGSMDAYVDTNGNGRRDTGEVSRLENMRLAMVDLITNLDNVNVGFMRFHNDDSDLGGPVIFPVKNLDDDVTTVRGEDDTLATLNYPVVDSSDDVEELTVSKAVTLDNTALSLAVREEHEVTRRIVTTSDDANQRNPNENADLNDTILDFAYDDYIGLRFQDVKVPAGVKINSAFLSFEATDSDSGSLSPGVTIWGVADTTPPTFTATFDNVRNQPRTAATAGPWNPPDWAQGDRYTAATTTPSLAPIVQEIIDTAGWADGNAMGFIIEDNSDGRRRARTYDTDAAAHEGAPRLTVRYDVPAEYQRVGLRFQDVRIPQGAVVTGAYLVFRTADPTVNSTSASLSIQVEEVDDAAAFSGAVGNVSAKSWSAGSVAWSPEEVTLDAGSPTPAIITSPNLSTLVQPVVDRASWCGGNSMAFSVMGSGTRAVHSYDSDPSLAPVLRVTYETDTIPVGKGCVTTDLVYQGEGNKDDGYEKTSNNDVTDNGPVYLAYYPARRGRSQVVTMLRFPGVTVQPGSTIVSAHIDFNAYRDGSGAITLNFKGDKSGNAATLVETDRNISNTTLRPRTSANVDWAIPGTSAGNWNSNDVYRSPDLASIVREATSAATGWTAGSSLAFYITGNSTNERQAYSVNYDASRAPRLILTVRERQLATGGSAGPKTVRERLIELVNEHGRGPAAGFTPSVETLYEAAQYWSGGAVDYGKSRGVRVSHEGSWTGGNLVRPLGCTAEDLDARACAGEEITGPARYEKPYGQDECQNNFMIFLSDGQPNRNREISKVESFIGTTCDQNDAARNLPNVQGAGGRCAYELAEYLNNTDLDPGNNGDQTVTTYTIGFNLDQIGDPDTTQWMQELAAAGGGDFYSADTASQLSDVLQSILTAILSKPTSFASPALSVNAFNKLFHRNDVYFALFKPTKSVRWDGNVKKYKICSKPNGADGVAGGGDDCILGEVLDATGASAIGSDSRIASSALSLWTVGAADGPTVEVGGAGSAMPDIADRNVYTDLGQASPATAFGDGTTTGVRLDDSADTMLTEANHADNAAIRTQACADPSVGNANCDEILEWLLGAKVSDKDTSRSASDSNQRWAFHDPLHSSPVIITFGGTDADPIEKIFVGTNDGGLRMLNAQTGEEEWVFVPSEFIEHAHLDAVKKNADGNHLYGIDLTPVSRIVDNNHDGVIDPAAGDYVHIYVGQRRGGRTLYALNVTPDSVIIDPDAVGGITPRFMWRIDGGTTAGFQRLGHSFSRPLLTDIRLGTGGNSAAAKKVLIFGGGYDMAVDEDYGTAGTSGAPNIGNAIYVVDPDDGSRILWISHAAAADSSYPGSGADIEMDNMVYAIPSDIAGMDSNGDGEVDRLYVGDTGGQVWRVDLGETLTSNSLGGTVVGRLANLASPRDGFDPTGENERKFFYQPDVVQVHDSIYSTDARYDLVVITSGDRANPLTRNVVDRIFAIRDYVTDGPMADANANGVADAPGTVTESDLQDVTENLLQTGSDAETSAEIADLKTASGWYIDLIEPPNGDKIGEKGLAPPIILAGKLFVTTFLPDVGVDPCQAQEGSGRIYALNVLNAVALDEWGLLDSTKTHDARANKLGAGIPSGAVPIFQEEGVTLLIGTGGGASVVDPNIQLPRERTYWYQENE